MEQESANLMKIFYHLISTKFGAQGNFDAADSTMWLFSLNFSRGCRLNEK